MKSRDRRRRAQTRRQKEAEHRRTFGVPRPYPGHQDTNGKRQCQWDNRMIEITVCIVRQHRDRGKCIDCEWGGGRAA